MMRNCLMIYGVLLSLLLTGCGKNMPLSGKITFNDGTPLSSGTIVFQCDKTLSRAPIQKDGTFVVGTEKNGNGVPKGKEFTVCITGAYEPLPDNAGMAAPVPLVDPKYNSATTSGLTFKSDGSVKKYDLVVERPDQALAEKMRAAIKKAPKSKPNAGPGSLTSKPAPKK